MLEYMPAPTSGQETHLSGAPRDTSARNTSCMGLFLEPGLPAFGKSFHFHRFLQQVEVRGRGEIKSLDVRDRDFLGIPAQDFDRVARGYRAFLLDQEVETAAPACEEQIGHIVTPELHAQFVAGQARLRNLQNRGSYLQPVADKKRVLAESFDSQVFTEGAVRKFEFGMFGFPHRIVLDG